MDIPLAHEDTRAAAPRIVRSTGPDAGRGPLIYSGPVSMFGAKAEIAALEKGIAHRVAHVPFDMHGLYEPKPDITSQINPKGQVPYLVHDDLAIFDSTQIFEFLEDIAPDPPLWPRDAAARARARLMELISDEVFFPHVVTCMPRRRKQSGEAAFERAAAQIADGFGEIEARLKDRDFLEGAFTYADIAFYPALFFADFLGQPPAAELTRLAAWRRRMADRESVATVMGAMAAYLTAHGMPASL